MMLLGIVLQAFILAKACFQTPAFYRSIILVRLMPVRCLKASLIESESAYLNLRTMVKIPWIE